MTQIESLTPSLPSVDATASLDSTAVRPGSPQLRELVERIGANVLERDRERRAPFGEYALLKQARLGALRIPVALGGGGATIRELFATVVDLAAADPDVAHSLRNHFVFVESRLRRGSDVASDALLARAAEGVIFGSAASEPGTQNIGEVATEYSSTLVRNGDSFVLNGTKIYSTGNLYADYILVVAQHEDGTIAQVLVPSERPGVWVEDDWDGIGQRLTGSGTTRFQNVRIEESDFLRDGSVFNDRVPYQATYPQLWLTAVIAGILRRATEDSVKLIKGRGRSYYHAPVERPTEDILLQETLGYIAANTYVAEATVRAAAEKLEQASAAILAGEPDRELSLSASLAAAKAKIAVDEIAQRTASLVFDVGGATAARQSAQLDRHWRNIRTLASHNPRSYKAKWVGDFELNGTALPSGAYF